MVAAAWQLLAFRRNPAESVFRIVLQALDGSPAGASHQEIAIALFGRTACRRRLVSSR
nr:DUF2285 domain-containing protein [Mesorhizobium caraganae]